MSILSTSARFQIYFNVLLKHEIQKKKINIVKKMEDNLYQKVVQLYSFMCMVNTEYHINSTNFMKFKTKEIC